MIKTKCANKTSHPDKNYLIHVFNRVTGNFAPVAVALVLRWVYL